MDFKLLHSWRAIQSKASDRLIFLICGLLLFSATSHAQELPPDFVFLRDVDSSIVQDIRYAGKFNFLGRPAPGYNAPECVLHRNAASAIAKAQLQMNEKGFRLKVFDCYRPHKATLAFMDWTKSPEANEHPEDFYPAMSKKALGEGKYISPSSTHSLGVAVDVTVVRPTDSALPTKVRGGGPCNGPFDTRASESSLDFGTTFDCFAEQSKTNHGALSEESQANRKLLLDIMRHNGFENYAREWWHFQLKAIPNDLKAQNFDIPYRQKR